MGISVPVDSTTCLFSGFSLNGNENVIINTPFVYPRAWWLTAAMIASASIVCFPDCIAMDMAADMMLSMTLGLLCDMLFSADIAASLMICALQL